MFLSLPLVFIVPHHLWNGMYRTLLALLVFVCGGLHVLAQSPFIHTVTHLVEPGSEPREHPVDIQRMTVDVKFDAPAGIVKGRVTHVFRTLRKRVDSIVFDAVGIEVFQATLGSRPVRYRSTDTTVVVYPEPSLRWDAEDSVSFTYQATPRKGLYFIGWNDATRRMRRQIWTQGQATDNRHWIPMYDDMNDKMITETIVTFDSSYAVLSNGTRVDAVVNGDGTKTWHYRMTRPHANYLLMIAVGMYDVTERHAASGVPLYLYSYPDYPDRIEPTYRMSVEAMDFLERETGIPYPWESYSQVPVADYVFGAMENTTATVFGDFFHVDARGFLDRSYVGVNVHELTHQWFGDLITGRSPKSIWLQESFATFYPHLFTRRTQGEDAYQWSRRGLHRSALAASEKDRFPIVHPNAGTARIYPKGAGVIDMMRYVFGEDEVRRVITHYLRRHAYGNVETNDLYLSFQDTLGITPDWFFDQWLYRGGEPHYEVSYSESVREGRKVTSVDVAQIHPVDELTGYFRMPIVVEVHYANGSKDSARAWVDGQRTTIDVPNSRGKDVDFVLFDPGSQVMKKVTFRRTWDEKVAQLKRAPLMIDRYDALEAMRGDTSKEAERLDLLADVMKNETYHAIRTEAIQQAAAMGLPQAWKIVAMGYTDKDVNVRTAALGAYAIIPAELKDAAMALLRDSSYAIVQQACQRLCASFPGEKATVLDVIKGEHGMHERVRIARLEVLASDGDMAAYDELADLCGPSWEFMTRQNAMQAVKRTGTLTPLSAANMIDALWSTNGRLAAVASGVLMALAEQPRWKSLVRTAVGGLVMKPWQRAIVDPLIR